MRKLVSEIVIGGHKQHLQLHKTIVSIQSSLPASTEF